MSLATECGQSLFSSKIHREEPKPTGAGGDATSSACVTRPANRVFFHYLLELKPAVSPVLVRLRSTFADLQAKERLLAVYSSNCSTFVFTLIFLACIPYYLTESLTSKEATTVVGVVAGLLGFVAVLLVAAVVAVIYKHRNKPNATGAVTLPLVSDNVPGPG